MALVADFFTKGVGMKSSVAVCFFAGFVCCACPGTMRAKSDPDAQYILSHVLGIVADGVSLAENSGDREAEESLQSGISILGHLGSIIAHVAQHRYPSAKPINIDELIALLTDNRALAEELGTALLKSKHLIKSAPAKSGQSIPVPEHSDL